MADVVDKIFNAGDKGWAACEECKIAHPELDKRVGKYAALKVHLEDVVNTRQVKFVFGDDAYFNSAENTLTVPHTKNAADALDLVDSVIFESYNAIRKDQFNQSKTFSDVNYDLVASGALTAQIEAGTMTDFYNMAMQMEEGDRTENMKKCIERARDAKGDLGAHFLASPHMSDPEKLKTLPPGDERRLPTAVLYIYQGISNSSSTKIRAAILKKCGVGFDIVEKINPINKRADKVLTMDGADSPLKTAAGALDALVKKNWPPASFEKRPGVLLKILEEVQQNADYVLLRNSVTEASFGFTAQMKDIAWINFPEKKLKD